MNNGWYSEKPMAQLLNASEVQERLGHLSGWTLAGSEIQCVRKFKDFIEAIQFVNRLVEPAEAAGHHPDIGISYNKVTICLTTHDAGGLTEKDFEMAQVISAIP
jgi:4a-hydroxytetrahydrobiopterin dehydratase